MRKRTLSPRGLALSFAALVVLIDQVTKVWAVAALSDGPIRVFGDVFRLALTRNTGAAFSSFTGGGRFIGVVALAVVMLVYYMVGRLHHRGDIVGLGLVMGGAMGNLLDRMFRGEGVLDGAVVDFLSPSFFPTFNVADVAINVGVLLLLIGALRRDP